MVPFYLLFLLLCQFGHFLQEEAQCDYSTKSLKQPFSLLDCLLEGWERWIFYLSFYFDWCYCRVGRIRTQWWCGLLRVLNHEHLIIRVSLEKVKKQYWYDSADSMALLNFDKFSQGGLCFLHGCERGFYTWGIDPYNCHVNGSLYSTIFFINMFFTRISKSTQSLRNKIEEYFSLINHN